MNYKEHYLLTQSCILQGKPSPNWAYLNAKLIEMFAVYVDKPECLNEDNLHILSDYFNFYVPDSFYANPQDLTQFTSEELFIEQLVSYLKVEFNGVRDMDPDTFRRVEMVHKVLPKYDDGFEDEREMVVRKFRVVTSEEGDEMVKEYVSGLCAYTRPWSEGETLYFAGFYEMGYYDGQFVKCADNALYMARTTNDATFAHMATKKDVVKYSIEYFGEGDDLYLSEREEELFTFLTDNARSCPLSKKQAKYYNTILKKIGKPKDATESNADSPYKKATALMKEGDVMGAAKVYAENGSLLERNLVYLLSRATNEQGREILEYMSGNNPIVMLQSLFGIINGQKEGNRTFTFYYNKKIKSHTETDEEKEKRHSLLTDEQRKYIVRFVKEKITAYYRSLPSLGKIYLSEEFKKVAIPFNTSTCGRGMDVMPTGSRSPIQGNALRLFCHWKDAFDIDVSATMITEDGRREQLYWMSYSEKAFGDLALYSGDCRDRTGAEYIDVKTDELAKKGYQYVLFTINGYEDRLNKGEIHCGYQNKWNLKTKVWQPKNIKFQIEVKGDSREYYAFAVDLKKKEVVTLNMIADSESRTVSDKILDVAIRYLEDSFLESANMYDVLSLRGELVSDPKDADVVFASNYIPQNGQKVVPPNDLGKLVSMLR